MNIYLTEITKFNPNTNKFEKFAGPRITAISYGEAEYFCKKMGIKLIGKLCSEINCNENLEPDFNNIIDYENLN